MLTVITCLGKPLSHCETIIWTMCALNIKTVVSSDDDDDSDDNNDML